MYLSVCVHEPLFIYLFLVGGGGGGVREKRKEGGSEEGDTPALM